MPTIAAIVPCYKVKNKIKQLLIELENHVDFIFAVDDHCPEGSGKYIEDLQLPKVTVLYNEKNLGVGGAMIRGFQEVLCKDIDIVVKIDGDGQMDPQLIKYFVAPIESGEFDYCKGNRFFEISSVQSMPLVRKIGNLGLSFLSKLSTGYWNIFDPTNGFFAIHTTTLSYLPLNKLSQRYFFETDMLFRLNILGARITDIPMIAKYEDEESNLVIKNIFLEFLFKHLNNFGKRIFYNYFLRDFNLGSLGLIFGLLLMSLGTILGIYFWSVGILNQQAATSGSVMLSALPIIIGFQAFLLFVNYDISKSHIHYPFYKKVLKK